MSTSDKFQHIYPHVNCWPAVTLLKESIFRYELFLFCKTTYDFCFMLVRIESCWANGARPSVSLSFVHTQTETSTHTRGLPHLDNKCSSCSLYSANGCNTQRGGCVRGNMTLLSLLFIIHKFSTSGWMLPLTGEDIHTLKLSSTGLWLKTKACADEKNLLRFDEWVLLSQELFYKMGFIKYAQYLVKGQRTVAFIGDLVLHIDKK